MAKVSISIDDDDLNWLKRRARRLYGGNLSAAVAEGARVIRQNEALGVLLDALGAPELTEADRKALDGELDGRMANELRAPTKPTRRRRRAA